MKIFFLITDKTAVSQRFVALNLAHAMKYDGKSVTIFCNGSEELRELFLEKGLQVVRVPLGGMFDVVSPVRISREINESDRIVILIFDESLILTANRVKNLGESRNAKVREIYMASGFSFSSLKPIRIRQFCDEIDLIVFPFNSAADRFRRVCEYVSDSKLSVIFPGVPSPSKVDSSISQSISQLNMVFLGEIVPQSGLNNLISSLEYLPPLPYHLTVVGTGQGRYVMPILRHSRSTGLDRNITWSGDDHGFAKLLAQSNIGIVPSSAPCDDYLSILIMLSYGLPVMTTNKGYGGEIKELLLHDSNQIIITEDNSPGSIAEKIRSASEYILQKGTGSVFPCDIAPFDFQRFYCELIGRMLSLFDIG